MTEIVVTQPALWEDSDIVQSGPEVVGKNELVGRPFRILKVTFNEGKFGEFVSLEVELDGPGGQSAVINDGSTGVYKQVVTYLKAKGIVPEGEEAFGRYDLALVCKKGLRRSDYEGPGGKPASTYYLA